MAQVCGLGFAVALSVVAILQLRANWSRMERVIDDEAEDLLRVHELEMYGERVGRLGRNYLLTGNALSLHQMQGAREEFRSALTKLTERAQSPAQRARFYVVGRASSRYEEAVGRAIGMRERGEHRDEIVHVLEDQVQPIRTELNAALARLTAAERGDLVAARNEAARHTSRTFRLLLAAVCVAAALGVWLTVLLRRTLGELARKRAELSATVAQLEERNRDLDAFAGRVAHDVRNILSPLVLLAGQVRALSVGAPGAQRVAERLERVSSRAGAMVDGLLSFARAGRPGGDAAARGSVREAVSGALESLEGLRDTVHALVEVDVEDLHDIHVRCPPPLLLDMIVNLVSNALKVLDGRAERVVVVTARARGRFCEISVKDTGPGIAPEHRSRIFEPFYRAPGSKGPGSGIGLATVQRIAEALDGSIVLSSEPGNGAIFVLSLPLADALPAISAGAAQARAS